MQGLKKLAGRRQQETSPELGYKISSTCSPRHRLTSTRIFQTPWQSIVSSTESLAQSHNMLAQKIEADVERPLREYQIKNREMQSMSTIQGNLAAMAREVDAAQKKSDKIKDKGGKAGKTANADSDLEVANQQWNSQAPFVFEQLQALDETRVNHLRDVLTQLETHEVDQIERSRITAESCLNALLNVDTADEISTFVARISGSSSSMTRPTVPPSRQQSRGATLSPPPPSRGQDDRASERSLSSTGVRRSESSGARGSRLTQQISHNADVMCSPRAETQSFERPQAPGHCDRARALEAGVTFTRQALAFQSQPTASRGELWSNADDSFARPINHKLSFITATTGAHGITAPRDSEINVGRPAHG